MQTEQRTLMRAEEVARAMLQAHADYATLDTGRYLAALEAGAQTALQQDVQPKLHAPWRRFFARMIDLLLYDLTWMVILTSAGLCAAGNRGVTLLNDFLALLTMLLLEPLLLHLFGTTPGKWLMGRSGTGAAGSDGACGFQNLPADAYRRSDCAAVCGKLRLHSQHGGLSEPGAV